MKLAIIDLDGVVANADARFKRAEEAKQAWLNSLENILRSEKRANDIYWREVFNPEYVPMDTLIDGAVEAINQLEIDNYTVVYLTSRPEAMRSATYAWMLERSLAGPKLIMKPEAAQYVKTVIWKALTIQMLVSFYRADDVLVVDDEPANLAKLQEYDTSSMRLCSSLAEAVTPVSPIEQEDVDNPF